LGKGGMLAESPERERELAHLAEADRHIAECKAHIANQRAAIERAIRADHPTDVAESVLDSLEESLHAFERTRRLIIDRLKELK
jgi:exonuclease VII small subunit